MHQPQRPGEHGLPLPAGYLLDAATMLANASRAAVATQPCALKGLRPTSDSILSEKHRPTTACSGPAAPAADAERYTDQDTAMRLHVTVR
jgi:hypothetical protein